MQLVADYKLPAITFERAGTKVMTRVVILDKGTGRHQVSRDWTGEDSIKEFFDRIQDAGAPERLRAPAEEVEAPPAPAPKAKPSAIADGQPPSMSVTSGVISAQFKHTKTGVAIYVATVTKKLGDTDFKAAVALAKRFGGHYSGYNGAGAIKGFHFETAEKRDNFSNTMTGGASKGDSSVTLNMLGLQDIYERIAESKTAQDAKAYLQEAAHRAYSEGKKTVAEWGKAMRSMLRDQWERFKSGMVELFRAVKTGIADMLDILNSERGSISVKKTVKAYKLFRTLKTRPGELFPLFIGKTDAVEVGKWVEAEYIPTKGYAPRPGWHAGANPSAPHLRSDGRIDASRVWAEVEMPDDVDWQAIADANKTGKKTRGDIPDRVPEGGHYAFNTSKKGSNGEQNPAWAWLIGGAIKINRVLNNKDVAAILAESGMDSEIAAETQENDGIFDQFKRGLSDVLNNERGSFSTKLKRNTGAPPPKGLVDENIKPAMVATGKVLISTMEGIRRTFTAGSRDPLSKQTARNLRELASFKARHLDQIAKLIEPARAYFDKYGGDPTDPNSRTFQFIHAIETGDIQGLPAIEQPYAKLNHIIFDNMLTRVKDRGRLSGTRSSADKLANPGRDFEAFYFPRLWKDEDEGMKVYMQLVAKRPFDGKKAFMKQRTIVLYEDGIAEGLIPAYDNPMDMIYHKCSEMEQWAMAQDWINAEESAGRVVQVPAGHSAPEGMIPLDSNIGTIWAGNTVPVWKMIRELAKTSKKDLFFEDFGKKVFPSALEIAAGADDTMKQEANALRWDTANAQINIHAMHRGTGRSYSELIVEKMLLDPARFEVEAPAIYKELEDIAANRPKIQGIMDMPGFEDLQMKLPVGGMIVKATRYAPEASASVFNNLVSKGLRGNDAFRAYLGAANILNQFQLGMSLFHAGFTSVDAAVSSAALGIVQLSHGDLIKALKSFAETPIAPVTNMLRGNQMMKEWDTPGSMSPEIATLVAAAQAGGARARMDKFYHTEITKNMMKAFRGGTVAQKLFLGVGRIPFALMEQSTKPILEWLVPRQKMGIIANAMKYEMELNPNMTHEELQAISAEIVDSVDNRMGQLIYDNIFWHKITKDLAMASVRSVGWNLGTIRELGGAVIDATIQTSRIARIGMNPVINMRRTRSGAYTGPRPRMTHKMSYLIALPLVVGLAGAILQYLATGLAPGDTDPTIPGDIGHGLTDIFNPRIGGIDKFGKPRRVIIPSYIKDIYHYMKDTPGTIASKLHPFLSMIGEMLRNKDYYGVEIRHKDDPFMKELLQLAEYTGKGFIPFSIRGIIKNIDEQAGLMNTLMPMIGITPAPSDINKTPAEKLAEEMIRERIPAGTRTKEDYDATQLKKAAVRAMKQGNGPKAQEIIKGLLQSGDLSLKGVGPLMEQAKHPYLYNLVNHLQDYAAVHKVYELASPAERAQLDPLIMKKDRSEMKSNPVKFMKQSGGKP